jgi:hypothetical protein
MNDYSPLDVAVALSLYAYNVDPTSRALKLYRHFHGECMEMDELIGILAGPRGIYAATELPAPTAAVYVTHALETYGPEARERNRDNLGPPT